MIPEYKRLMIEFIKILDDVQTDDQMQLKRMVLANCRKQCPQFLVHMIQTAAYDRDEGGQRVQGHRGAFCHSGEYAVSPDGSRIFTERKA